MGDYSWFDIKAKSGTLKYEDKKKLFNQIFDDSGVVLTTRAKKSLEKILQQQIFNLRSNSGGSESAHTIAHSILTCFAPIMGLNEEQYQKYLSEYQKAIKKHDGCCVFKKNYQQSSSG